MSGSPNAMFSMVIVAPAVAVGLFSLVAASLEVAVSAAVAVSVVSSVLLDPPHAVAIAAIRLMVAKNMQIFFIVSPNFSSYRDTIIDANRFSRVRIADLECRRKRTD